MRIANVGRRRRKNPDERGFWLDLREGRWLTDKQATDATVDTDDLPDAEDVKEREKVVPFVQDRRNILIVRATTHLEDEVAVSLRAALERAVEAEFQLEDAELDSRELPDATEQGRMLLHRGRGRRRRRPAATRRRARRDPAGGPQGAGDHPLRPRHRRRPRARRRRPRPLRARLLRLPALLRQPVRAHPHQPAQRRRDPAQPPRRPRRGRRRRTPPRRPGRLAHQARRLDPGVPLHLLAPLHRAAASPTTPSAPSRPAAPDPTSSTTAPSRSRSSSTAPTTTPTPSSSATARPKPASPTRPGS